MNACERFYLSIPVRKSRRLDLYSASSNLGDEQWEKLGIDATTFKPSTHHPRRRRQRLNHSSAVHQSDCFVPTTNDAEHAKKHSGNEHDSVLRQTFTRLTVLAANTKITTSTFLDPSQHQPNPHANLAPYRHELARENDAITYFSSSKITQPRP